MSRSHKELCFTLLSIFFLSCMDAGVGYNESPPVDCDNGETRCEGDRLFHCDGGEWKLLDDCGAVPVHFVYVSSVLSLAPRGTAWYGGWKNVVEDAAATLLARSPNARLSVLFPGRLISQRRAELPASALYTKFSSLASRIDRILAQGRPVRRVVGLDARAWLVVRSLSNLGRLVFNRF